MYSTYPPPRAGEVLVPLPPQQKNVHPSRRPQAAALRDNLVLESTGGASLRKVRSAVTDIESASAADHHCATRIASAWRGFILRRHLASRNITMSFQNMKAMKIQCFIRCFFARRATQLLRARREQVCNKRNVVLIADRLKELKAAIKWQAALFEKSALKIQQMYRWKYSRRRSSIVVNADGEERSVMEELTDPTAISKRQYMPRYWRRRSTVARGDMEITTDPSSPRKYRDGRLAASDDTPLEKVMLSSAPPRGGNFLGGDNSSPTRSLPYLAGSPASMRPPNGSTQLALYERNGTGRDKAGSELVMLSPQPPSHKRFEGPPSQLTVEAINARNRQRDSEINELIETEPQQLRIRERVDGILQQDLDHCAGVLQRRFRIALAKQTYHSRQCVSEYTYRYAVVIQNAFRSFLARSEASQHRRDIAEDISLASQKYGISQVERLKQEFVWNAHVMSRAAIVLQTGYRRYRYLSKFHPETSKISYEDYFRQGPKSLPLGILKDIPKHKTSAQSSHRSDDQGVPKYVFRQHKSPEARKRFAEERARQVVEKTKQEEDETARSVPEEEPASAEVVPEEEAAPAEVVPEEEAAPAEVVPEEEAKTIAGHEPEVAIITTPPMRVLDDGEEARYPGVDQDDGVPHADRRTPVDPQTDAATKIQCSYRQHSARKEVAHLKELRDASFEESVQNEAARTIQEAVRRRKSPKGHSGSTSPGEGVTPPQVPDPAITAVEL